MLVSVIIPTFNSARFLPEAIDSVLVQTFRDFEVIVVDDGSTDETESLMGKYGAPVRYIRQANCGVAAARNRGIEESLGRYVAFLDADDTWYGDKLERQLAALRSNPQHRACYTAFTACDADLSPLYIIRSRRRGSTLRDLLLLGNVVATPSTVLCERSLFETVSGFDPALSLCADWDMWVRLAAHTEFLYLDEPTVTYRRHDSNMSRNVRLLESDSLQVLEKGFAMADLSDSIKSKRRAAFARNYMVLAGTYFHAGSYAGFSRCAARAVAMDFRQIGRLLTYPGRLTSQLLPRRDPEAT
jgi:glycosyltransferase involved in cell wall biosynthesis